MPNLSDDINTTPSIHQQMEELTRKIEKEKLVIQMMTASSQNVIADADVSITVIKYVRFKLHNKNNF